MNPHAWNLVGLKKPTKKSPKVMTTFACGGGPSLGYKLAGCDVVAANDIDPEMAWHYQHNLPPKHYFLCPIRDLLTQELPDDLFHLDILDGSPPCSTFSVVGEREKNWGKEKHFREGQAKQVLSDLFFDYLDLVGHLKPKVAIAENVKGMLVANARSCVNMIVERFQEIGYRVQVFLVNAADCGVPQCRERVFFCAIRDDIQAPKLVLQPKEKWVSAGEACSGIQELTQAEVANTRVPAHDRWWGLCKKGSSYAKLKVTGGNYFSWSRLDDAKPSPTLVSRTAQGPAHWDECRALTFREWKRLGSFPDDCVAKTDALGKYLVGMSVPPKMMAYIAREVAHQWLGV